MNKLYKIRRQWQVPGWTDKHGGWVSITNSFYRYLSEDAGVHDPENSLEVFNTFDELYDAAKHYSQIIADKTPITKKRRITISGYWLLGESFVIVEGRDTKCFPIKTRLNSSFDVAIDTIKELANFLPADDFCKYLVDHGLGGADIGNFA